MRNRMIYKIYIPIIFLTLLLFSIPVYGQMDFAFTWYLIRDDNAFKNRNLYDELINTLSLSTGRTFSTNRSFFRIYYNGDYSTFSNYKDRRNNSHQIGTAVSRLISDKVIVNIGANGRIRRNNAQYIYYNVDTYNFYANFRYEPDYTKIFTGGVVLAKSNFKEFSDINNNEYRIFARYQQFFQNRFSFTGEIGFRNKNYVNQTKLDYFGFMRFFEESIRATFFSTNVNLGKSLTNKTGMNLGLGGRLFIGKPIEIFTDNGIYYYTENDLYDDPYGYENYFVNFNLTRQFMIGFQGKIGAEYQKKDYKGTPALSMDGELLGYYRKDTRADYYFSLGKTFKTGWSFPSAVDGFFRFLIRDNASNDPYFDYFDHLALVGLTIRR